MQIHTKTLKNGFSMPVFGIGTWMMGGTKVYDPSNDDQADITAIKTAVELGVIHIDTAQNYADGHAEKLVGQAIKDYERNKLFITTKIRTENLRSEDTRSSFLQSLERLQTDYVDLLLIHSPHIEVAPFEETLIVMNDFVKKGVVKNLGVSNFSVKQMQEAQRVSEARLVNNQVHYNLKYREVEQKGVLSYSQDNDILLTAYRPLQKGILLVDNEVFSKLCKKYEKTKAQVALNWLIAQQNVVAIVKARSIEHLKENIGAVGWNMEKDDVERLRKEFPGQEIISDVHPFDD